MRFSIVIVTYNAVEYIAECVESVLKNAKDSKSIEIIIVDNASNDGTLQKLSELRTIFSNVKVLPQTTNLGFTKGCNLGARHASAPVVFFLNPDTICLTPDWDLKLEEGYIRGGITGINFFFKDGTPQFPIGQFPTKISRVVLDRIPFFRKWFGVLLRDERFYNKKRKVDWVCGCGLIIEKTIFEKLGGFDENIFMYWDEMDLCFRAMQSGYPTYFIPGINFIHLEDGDSKLRKPKKMFYIRNNLILFYRKHHFYVTLFLFKCVLLFESIRRIFGALIRKRSSTEKELIARTFKLIFS